MRGHVKHWLAIALCAIAAAPSGASTEPSAAQASAQPSSRVQWVESPRQLRDFSLTDQDGQPFQWSSLRGGTVLVFFGFTNCPNVCPPTMQRLRQVQRALQSDDGALTSVLISVDGERDTPAVMKAYLAPFMPGFIGLTGHPKAVRAIADDFAAVFFKGMPTDTMGGYNVEHTSQVYLVDREGRLRATFYQASADEMIDTTRRVMRAE